MTLGHFNLCEGSLQPEKGGQNYHEISHYKITYSIIPLFRYFLFCVFQISCYCCLYTCLFTESQWVNLTTQWL